MGATEDDLELFLHVEPETPADETILGEPVQEWNPTVVLIDAAAGAYALQGLDDNKRQDAELFTVTMIDPFRVRGVATVVLDHVTKNSETRGSFAIGSERNVGGTDVHLGFEPVVPFGRGRLGLVNVKTHKDRFGYLPRPTACELELRSDPTTGAVTWEFRPVESEAREEWQPTVLMEKVSRFLEHQDEPVPRSVVESEKLGTSATYLRQAMDALIADGYVRETKGARSARLMSSVRPFREHTDPELFTSSDLVRPRLDDVSSPRLTSSVPYKGDEVADEDEHALANTTSSRTNTPPLIGDPGYPLFADAVYTAGHITADELRNQLSLAAVVRRALQAA